MTPFRTKEPTNQMHNGNPAPFPLNVIQSGEECHYRVRTFLGQPKAAAHIRTEPSKKRVSRTTTGRGDSLPILKDPSPGSTSCRPPPTASSIQRKSPGESGHVTGTSKRAPRREGGRTTAPSRPGRVARTGLRATNRPGADGQNRNGALIQNYEGGCTNKRTDRKALYPSHPPGSNQLNRSTSSPSSPPGIRSGSSPPGGSSV